jgi:hypothetical protein
MPSGRKPGSQTRKTKQNLPRDIVAARKLNAIEFERIVNRVLFTSMGNFEALMDPSNEVNRENLVIEQMVMALVRSAIQKGDHTKLEFILNRVLGKVADRVQIEAIRPVLIEDIETQRTVTLTAKDYSALPEPLDTRLDREKHEPII